MNRLETHPIRPIRALRELGLSALALNKITNSPELTSREKFFTLQVILGCPELSGKTQIVSSVVKYGMFIDDYFDTGINRQKTVELLQTQRAHGQYTGIQIAEPLRNIEYELNNRLITVVNQQGRTSEKERDLANIAAWQKTCWDSEVGPLYVPLNKWTPELVRKYRELGTFIWSTLFASLAPDSKLVLPQPLRTEYAQKPEATIEVLHKQYSEYLPRAGNEGKRALSLAYQMMIVQVYGDVRGREWNMQQGIPGFAGIGYPNDVVPEEVLKKEMQHYSNQAEAMGMNRFKSTLFKKLYPEIYNTYTKIIHSWDAAQKS